MEAHLTKGGWLPAAIAGRYPVVRWIYAGEASLQQPFFESSVAGFRGGNPPAPEIETDLSPLLAAASALPPVSPAGVILHVSRCGSTLVLNALKSAEGAVAISEAQPFSRAMELAAAPSRYWAARGGALLDSLVRVFACYQGSPHKHVVIKCAADGVLAVGAMRALWPGVPLLVLIREPVEVIVSNLRTPPRWLAKWGGDLQRHPLGDPPVEVTSRPEALCAWSVGRFCAEALNAVDERCMVIDYEELCPERVEEIAAFFGLQFSSAGIDSVRRAFDTHAKNGRPFVADAAAKREGATEQVRRDAETWAAEPYALLKRCAARADSSPSTANTDGDDARLEPQRHSSAAL
ncbi:MAG TPA: hypothetical protein VH639_25190 [Bryobacteraceae bacterium]